MTANTLYRKTIAFTFLKLALGITAAILSAGLYAILMAVSPAFGQDGKGIAFLLWAAAAAGIWRGLVKPLSARLHIIHIAAIQAGITTGQVPAHPEVRLNKKTVSRFGTLGSGTAVYTLLRGSVKQIQARIEHAGEPLEKAAGSSIRAGVLRIMIRLCAKHAAGCCMGYTVRSSKDVRKSAADAAVIYTRNWKALLSDAPEWCAKAGSLTVVLTAALLLPIGLVFHSLQWSGLAALLLASLTAWVIKSAVLDPAFLCRMMVRFTAAAETAQAPEELYGRLYGLSESFQKLYNSIPWEARSGSGALHTPPTQETDDRSEVWFCTGCPTKHGR